MKRQIFIITVFLTLLFLGNSFASAQESDATLEFRPSVLQANLDDEISVDIILKNPGQQKVISVRAWMQYDANALEGVSIDTQDSPFTLTAPGEDEFGSSDGYVKIGRSNITGGVVDSEVKVATVNFKVKTPNALTTVIFPYDYQFTELGHTSVNIIDQGFPVNILTDEPLDVRVQLNPGAAFDNSGTGNPQDYIDNTISDSYSNGYANLMRPQNLRVNTGSGYVDLKWDITNESELIGYNIYYGKTSGHYTRRRSVDRVDNYRIDGLNNNETYYFSITAYDALNRESDYSDEVGIIINQPLSSTSPFDGFMDSMLAKLPAQPQNGPLTGWILFSAITVGGMAVFRKKKCHL